MNKSFPVWRVNSFTEEIKENGAEIEQMPAGGIVGRTVGAALIAFMQEFPEFSAGSCSTLLTLQRLVCLKSEHCGPFAHMLSRPFDLYERYSTPWGASPFLLTYGGTPPLPQKSLRDEGVHEKLRKLQSINRNICRFAGNRHSRLEENVYPCKEEEVKHGHPRTPLP